eukprot:jgi/Tetstr1/433621/TSEL_022886.t1
MQTSITSYHWPSFATPGPLRLRGGPARPYHVATHFQAALRITLQDLSAVKKTHSILSKRPDTTSGEEGLSIL